MKPTQTQNPGYLQNAPMPRKQEAAKVRSAVFSGPLDEAGGGAVRTSRVPKPITRPAEILSQFDDGDRIAARVRPSLMLVVCAALGLGVYCCFPGVSQVPTVTTLPASNVNLAGARLQGTVNANGLATK